MQSYKLNTQHQIFLHYVCWGMLIYIFLTVLMPPLFATQYSY